MSISVHTKRLWSGFYKTQRTSNHLEDFTICGGTNVIRPFEIRKELRGNFAVQDWIGSVKQSIS